MLVAESQAGRGVSRCSVMDGDADQMRRALLDFADIMSDELHDVEKLFDELERSRARFLSKFEENRSMSLDSLLSVLAQLVAELRASAAKRSTASSQVGSPSPHRSSQ